MGHAETSEMPRPIRRDDRAVTSSEAEAILRQETYGVLSMIGSDGKPYAIPLSYVFHDSAIYFHCATEGRKLDCIDAHPAVSFCVVGHTKTLSRQFATEYESTVVFGTAARVAGEEKRAALIAILEKYSPDFMASGLKYMEAKMEQVVVIRMDVDYFRGKARRA